MSQLMQTVDGVSQATPLDTFKTALRSGHSPEDIFRQPLFSATVAGMGWQWVNLGFLLGGLFLLQRGTIRWHIPVSFLLTLTLCASLGWILSPENARRRCCTCFPAPPCWGVFIATDPVTASTTNRGRLILAR